MPTTQTVKKAKSKQEQTASKTTPGSYPWSGPLPETRPCTPNQCENSQIAWPGVSWNTEDWRDEEKQICRKGHSWCRVGYADQLNWVQMPASGPSLLQNKSVATQFKNMQLMWTQETVAWFEAKTVSLRILWTSTTSRHQRSREYLQLGTSTMDNWSCKAGTAWRACGCDLGYTHQLGRSISITNEAGSRLSLLSGSSRQLFSSAGSKLGENSSVMISLILMIMYLLPYKCEHHVVFFVYKTPFKLRNNGSVDRINSKLGCLFALPAC